MFFAPGVVIAPTVAWNEKILSFAVTSPLVALSKKVCVADPPIAVRSAVTAVPVLAGLMVTLWLR